VSDFALQRLSTLPYTCFSKRTPRAESRSPQTTSAATASRSPQKSPESVVLLCLPNKELHNDRRDKQPVRSGRAQQAAILLRALTRHLVACGPNGTLLACGRMCSLLACGRKKLPKPMFTAERRLQRNGVYRARNDVYSATAFTAERRLPRNDVFAAAVAVAAAAVSAADAAAAASTLAQPLTLASYP